MDPFRSTNGRLFFEFDYRAYNNCKFLLRGDYFVRRVADAFCDEALETHIKLTSGGVESGEGDGRAAELVDKHGRDVLIESFCAGLVVVLFENVTRSKKRKRGEPSATVVTEGLGDWLQLWIETEIKHNKRRYVLRRRGKEGRFEDVPREGFAVFDCFNASPTYDGKIRSRISTLIEPARFYMQMRFWEEHATYNMSHPAIVTETERSSFGMKDLEEVTGKHAGWSAAMATREIGSEGSLARFEYQKSKTELEILVRNAVELANSYYGKITDGIESQNKELDQVRGAVRPLGPGHKVANHHIAQVRADAAALRQQYEEIVAVAFGIDRGAIQGFAGRVVGVVAMQRSEQFMVKAFNSARASLSLVFTEMFTVLYVIPHLSKKTVRDLQADPSLIEKSRATVTLLSSLSLGIDDLIKLRKEGLMNDEDYLKAAEGLLAVKLHGEGMPDPAPVTPSKP